MTQVQWIIAATSTVSLVAFAIWVRWLWRQPCSACAATPRSAGNPAGQCFHHWSSTPAIFPGEAE